MKSGICKLVRKSGIFFLSAVLQIMCFICNTMNFKCSFSYSYLYFLKEKTFVCEECKGKKPDSKKPNITLCTCSKSHKGAYEDWVIFIEREDLIVWRRPLHGYYEYKVYGSYDDVTAIDFLDTQMDTEYRKKWDNTAVALEIVEKDENSNSDIIYWEMLWPVSIKH